MSLDKFKTASGGNLSTELAVNTHNHDSRYYTEAEVNSLIAGRASTSHSHTLAAHIKIRGSVSNRLQWNGGSAGNVYVNYSQW